MEKDLARLHDFGEIPHICQIDGDLDNLVPAAARGVQKPVNIVEYLLQLRIEITGANDFTLFIDRRLTGKEYHIPDLPTRRYRIRGERIGIELDDLFICAHDGSSFKA